MLATVTMIRSISLHQLLIVERMILKLKNERGQASLEILLIVDTNINLKLKNERGGQASLEILLIVDTSINLKL